MKRLLWPVSRAAMSPIGRDLLREAAVLAHIAGRGRCLPYEVAVLARIAGRYEPYLPLFAV